MPGITVELKDSAGERKFSTSTDADGRYQFSDAPSGEYSLAVTAEGFDPFAVTIILKPGENRSQGITLELASVVQKVEVHDKAESVSTQGPDPTATISARQFTTLPLAEQKF
ncbi:MAG TPA: carboxypeptidase-like regulatory domain-containing protein, partial [Terriglobia bacterium]|nr:carboxypeptidase-like regulatory domain-containing protein [Terriglobia bacterium]